MCMYNFDKININLKNMFSENEDTSPWKHFFPSFDTGLFIIINTYKMHNMC